VVLTVIFLPGVVICKLLEILTGKKIKGINRRPKNPLQISSNLSILWKFMKNSEHIELGGINTNGADLELSECCSCDLT